MGKQMCPWGPRLSHRVQSSSAENPTRGLRSSSSRRGPFALAQVWAPVLGSLSEGRLVQGSILMLPRRLLREVQPAPLVLGLPRGLLSPAPLKYGPSFLRCHPSRGQDCGRPESLLLGIQKLAAFLGSAYT